MSDDSITPSVSPVRDSSTANPVAIPSTPPQVAKIKILAKGVQAKGFTFGAGQVVAGVSLEMAKLLVANGEAKIIDISEA